MLWDEENRLLALSDNGFVSNYWYDASGERTVKESGDNEGVTVNGLQSAGRTGTTNFTAYVSPYMVVSPGGNYSKHIYIGSQRIVSKLGSLNFYGTDPRIADYAGKVNGLNTIDFTTKYTTAVQSLKTRYDSLGVTYRGTDNKPTGTNFYAGNPGNSIDLLSYGYYHVGSTVGGKISDNVILIY